MEKKFMKQLIAFLTLVPGSLSVCGKKPREDRLGEADRPTNSYTLPVNEDGHIVIE